MNRAMTLQNPFCWIKKLVATRGRRRGIHYINGPDVLPQPLSKEEESTVIAVMEEGEWGGGGSFAAH